MHNLPSILVLTDWFAPGYKAGGPIRSCINFSVEMQHNYQIFILTGDRDFGDEHPYEGIERDTWQDYEQTVKVFYCSLEKQNYGNLLSIMREVSPDFVYLNSMFSLKFTIFPLLMMRRGQLDSQFVLAPRGMLKNSALQYKKLKKSVFLKVLSFLKIPQRLTFHATDKVEREDVVRTFGQRTRVQIIPNFLPKSKNGWGSARKMAGKVDLVFIGRIHPIKNLLYLVKLMRNTKARVHLTIVGPVEDSEYWRQCQLALQGLPYNVEYEFLDEVPHSQLFPIISNKHLFVLPSSGENYGHAIFEALVAGKPILISDQTPLKNLEVQKVGWDIPLNRPERFVEAIDFTAQMNQAEYDEWSKSAWDFAKEFLETSDIQAKYLRLFS